MSIWVDYREKYLEIMKNEQKLSGNCDFMIVEPVEAYDTVRRLMEVMGISFVSRGYNKKYHVSKSDEKSEMVAAHTNLTISLLMKFLRWRYGDSETMKTEDGFNFFSVIEAMGRHDLPENETGDTPDDGNRDEEKKIRIEQAYQRRYSKMAPYRDAKFEIEVLRLLALMEQHERPGTGRVLYLADKISALFITLYLNTIGKSPYVTIGSVGMTERDMAEINVIWGDKEKPIDWRRKFFASEMWAIDYFKERGIINYDETGYFTSLVVMATLMMNNGKWYQWREQDYNKLP